MLAAVLADDLTGALEVGALAAAGGRSVRVHLALDAPPGPEDVSVFDTATRHASHATTDRFDAALARVRSVAPWIYKKVDSTLRGPIALELAALRRGRPDVPLVYVPAYPALGRTVVRGELHVDGVPLTETAFAEDPRHAARSSSVIDLFEDIAPAVVVGSANELALELSTMTRRATGAGVPSPILVCDAESDLDLDGIAGVVRAASSRPTIAGSGGFASRWVADLPGRHGRPPGLPRAMNPIVVSGSRHPASARQVDAARRAGVACVVPADATGRRPDDVARALAASAARRIDTVAPDVVILFGGDTAAAVLGELGCGALIPLGEVLPGMPVSTWDGLTIVTKAGGFGDDDVVAAIMEALR